MCTPLSSHIAQETTEYCQQAEMEHWLCLVSVSAKWPERGCSPMANQGPGCELTWGLFLIL